MLETLPVHELAYGEAREHVAYCPDCNRVTRVVAARERNMTLAYENAYPSASAATVVERAIATARRHRIASYYRAALGVAAVVVIALFVVTRRMPVDSVRQPALFERFSLQCLSSDQAAELVRREVPNGERISIRARPRVAVIEVRGSADEVRVVRSVIDQFDNSDRAKCAAQVVVPKAARAMRVDIP
jgi:type II secretory pathway component GspD/PulD (secretin)